MAEQYITIEIKYDSCNPEVSSGMTIQELAYEFDSNNEITSVSFYNALTNEED